MLNKESACKKTKFLPCLQVAFYCSYFVIYLKNEATSAALLKMAKLFQKENRNSSKRYLILCCIQFVFHFRSVLSNASDETTKCNGLNEVSNASSVDVETKAKHAKFQFASSAVPNEYIVYFDGYYQTNERKQFINKAMILHGKNSSDWLIHAHRQVVESDPSDFDVVKVHSEFSFKVTLI